MTNHIENDYLSLMSYIYSIVKPDNVQGYIYSFFNLYNDNTSQLDTTKKKEITSKTDLSIFPLLGIRDDKYYDKENDTITLLDYEINFINDSLFRKKVDRLYDSLIINIERFDQNYFLTKKFTVISYYEEILSFIKDTNGAYRSGNLKNTAQLNLNIFKDYVQQKNDNLIRNIELRINSVPIQTQTKQIGNYSPENIRLSREQIINKLIGLQTSKHNKFLDYEKRLIIEGYLNSERSLWLKGAASFIRFYIYCENKSIFKNDIYGITAEGVKLLRDLYNFNEGKNLDFPTKREKQATPRTKLEFSFLDFC
jgi:hypothetical protein